LLKLLADQTGESGLKSPMREVRLKSEYWVQAHLRKCNAVGVPAYVARYGDNDRGLVVLKINTLVEGCRVYTQTRDMDGNLAWLAALGGELTAERDADAYIARQTDRDPDLWVVEIEDREGRRWFEGDVI
jgi:hypothetical protein